MDKKIEHINELQGFQIYNQYANDTVYFEFFKVVKQFFYDKYIQSAQNIFDTRLPSKVIELDIDTTLIDKDQAMQYFLFYYANIFGFYSPLGRADGKNLYDDNKLHDKGLKWDDMSGNGFIPIEDYITIIRYFMDYSSGAWSYGWLSRLIIDYVRTTKFIIEPELFGCVVHAVVDTKGKLAILSNIFTNRDLYGFIPLQRVKFNILYNDEDLQKEIERIYNENDVVQQEKPEIDTDVDSETEQEDIPQYVTKDYVSKYSYAYKSKLDNMLPVDNEKVSWYNHCGFDVDCTQIQEYLLCMIQPSLLRVQFVHINGSASGNIKEFLELENKSAEDLKQDRSLRDRAKEYICNKQLEPYKKLQEQSYFEFVPRESERALAQGGVDTSNMMSFAGYTIGLKEGYSIEQLDYYKKDPAWQQSFIQLLQMCGYLALIDWNVEEGLIAKRIEQLNTCLILRSHAMYYGGGVDSPYLIYQTAVNVMNNELPNYFNHENINNLFFYELAHLYIAKRVTYNTNLERADIESKIIELNKYYSRSATFTNLQYLDDDELLEVLQFLECYMYYLEIHAYSNMPKDNLRAQIKTLYPKISNYASLLEKLRGLQEVDFTHMKPYDIKACLNECQIFIRYFKEKLKVKDNEIATRSFLDNVNKTSFYEYLVFLFDTREKNYYKLPHHDLIQKEDFFKAQKALESLLSRFNDDELELHKPNIQDTNAPEIDSNIPAWAQEYDSRLITNMLTKYKEIKEANLSAKTTDELGVYTGYLFVYYYFVYSVYNLKMGANTQTELINGLNSVANGAGVSCADFNEFLFHTDTIAAYMQRMNTNVRVSDLEQAIQQVDSTLQSLDSLS